MSATAGLEELGDEEFLPEDKEDQKNGDGFQLSAEVRDLMEK